MLLIWSLKKIFISLNEEHRRTTLSVIICALILHSIFYASSVFYRDIEWYNQLLFSFGVSACYVGTIVFIFFWLIKLVYLSYLSIPLLSLPGICEFIRAARSGTFNFNYFLFGLGSCFTIMLLFFIFLKFKEEINSRGKTKKEESKGNT